MPLVKGRSAAFVAFAALLSACTSQGGGPAATGASNTLAQPPASVAAAAPMSGDEAQYCPTVTLLEGTAILTKKAADKIDYVASITDTSRDCRIQDGKLVMHVGAVGKVTPGPAAKSRNVTLPIRVAIRRGTDLVYSKLGKKTVPISQAAGTKDFTYVDSDVVIDKPTKRNVTILLGFDELGG